MKPATLVTTLCLLLVPGLPGTAQIPDFQDPFLIRDLEPGPAGSSIDLLLPVLGRAVFVLDADPMTREELELWVTDGTPGGTSRLEAGDLDLDVPRPDFRATGELLYFLGIDEGSGRQGLWRTDGTTAGTIELAEDLALGPSFTRGLGDSPILFVAGPPTQAPDEMDLALWTTDGTPGGTHPIHDIDLSAAGFRGHLIDLDGTVYFLDTNPDQDAIGLWKTDGTAEGTGVRPCPRERQLPAHPAERLRPLHHTPQRQRGHPRPLAQ